MSSGMLTMSDRDGWRAWLAENHDRQSEAWLIFFKGRAAQAGISYEDAVEEALCFGWIDSRAQRVDEERYAQRFSPRKRKSAWSESNIQRIRKLIREGRMTPAGLAVIPAKLLGDASEGAVAKEELP